MMNKQRYKCDSCVKQLSCYKSLWRHKKKFHERCYNTGETSVWIDQSPEFPQKVSLNNPDERKSYSGSSSEMENCTTEDAGIASYAWNNDDDDAD